MTALGKEGRAKLRATILSTRRNMRPPGWEKTLARLDRADGVKTIRDAVARVPHKSRPSEGPVAWAYGRVSTLEQDVTCSSQKCEAEEYFERKLKERYAWGGFFSDGAVSGSTNFAERKAGGQILKLLLPGDTLIVAKIDRLSRSIVDFVHTVLKCKEMGVNIIAIDMGLDLTTPQGKLIAGIFALFAEWDNELRKLRTREFMETANKGGYLAGTQGAPPGYIRVREMKFTEYKVYSVRPCPLQQIFAARLHDWHIEQRLPMNAIASYLEKEGFLIPLDRTMPKRNFSSTKNNVYFRRVRMFLNAWDYLKDNKDNVIGDWDSIRDRLEEFYDPKSADILRRGPVANTHRRDARGRASNSLIRESNARRFERIEALSEIANRRRADAGVDPDGTDGASAT